jgi:DNA-binding NarL/FixJ family response regulator
MPNLLALSISGLIPSLSMITVLLVDDYPAIRQLLRDILDDYPDIQVIGEAATGQEAVAKCAALRPAVVVIDLRLPSMSGTDATAVIKRQRPSTTVIAAGTSADAELRMRTAGAAIVLNKGDILERLYPAIVEEGMLSKIAAHLVI